MDEAAKTPLVTEESGPRPSLGRVVGHVVLYLVVFALACALIRRALPRPEGAWTTDKLEYFAAHKEQYDTLFLGPSTVYRHVDPALFDSLMAERGHATSSFNLGIVGMVGVEMRFVLDEVLAMEPRALKTVFLDVRIPGGEVAGRNHLSARVAYWHDLPTTLLAAALVWHSEEPRPWKWEQLGKHAAAFGLRTANVGRLREQLEEVLGGTALSRERAAARSERTAQEQLGARGFLPLEEEYRLAEPGRKRQLWERRDDWLRNADDVMARLADQRARGRPLLNSAGTPREDQRLTEPERRLVLELVAALEARGIRAVFITSPDVRQRAFYVRAAAREGLTTTTFDLDDPVRHPQLFARERQFDQTHLDTEGAALFTELIARRFTALLDEEASSGVGGPGVEKDEGSPSGPRDGDADRDDESADPEPGTSAGPGAGSDRDGGQRR